MKRKISKNLKVNTTDKYDDDNDDRVEFESIHNETTPAFTQEQQKNFQMDSKVDITDSYDAGLVEFEPIQTETQTSTKEQEDARKTTVDTCFEEDDKDNTNLETNVIIIAYDSHHSHNPSLVNTNNTVVVSESSSISNSSNSCCSSSNNTNFETYIATTSCSRSSNSIKQLVLSNDNTVGVSESTLTKSISSRSKNNNTNNANKTNQEQEKIVDVTETNKNNDDNENYDYDADGRVQLEEQLKRLDTKIEYMNNQFDMKLNETRIDIENQMKNYIDDHFELYENIIRRVFDEKIQSFQDHVKRENEKNIQKVIKEEIQRTLLLLKKNKKKHSNHHVVTTEQPQQEQYGCCYDDVKRSKRVKAKKGSDTKLSDCHSEQQRQHRPERTIQQQQQDSSTITSNTTSTKNAMIRKKKQLSRALTRLSKRTVTVQPSYEGRQVVVLQNQHNHNSNNEGYDTVMLGRGIHKFIHQPPQPRRMII